MYFIHVVYIVHCTLYTSIHSVYFRLYTLCTRYSPVLGTGQQLSMLSWPSTSYQYGWSALSLCSGIILTTEHTLYFTQCTVYCTLHHMYFILCRLRTSCHPSLVISVAWLVCIPPSLMSLTTAGIIIPSLGSYIEVSIHLVMLVILYRRVFI